MSCGGEVALIKIDPSGDTLWSREYEFGGIYSQPTYVQQTMDGGYILTGSTQAFGAGGYDVLLMKIDSLGLTQWSRAYGGPSHDRGRAVQETPDGGFILFGYTHSFGVGENPVLLIRTNSSGDVVWSRTYGWDDSDDCRLGGSVQQTTDGGYVIAGYFYPPDGYYRDGWLIKTDSNGDVLWVRRYGGYYGASFRNFQQTEDGGYILVGSSVLFTGSSGLWVVKTDSNGDIQWSRGCGRDMRTGFSVQQTADGGYIVASWACFPDSRTSADLSLIKMDSLGNSCIGGFVFPDVEAAPCSVTNPPLELNSGQLTMTIPTVSITWPSREFAIVCDGMPPIADAGDDQLGVTGSIVTLDGSGSYDPEGADVFFDWDQISGPSTTLSDTTAMYPTFTPALKGNYRFGLVVNDGLAYSRVDTVSVQILARGDATADGKIDIADVVYLVNYLFIDGPAPEPLEAGDANCDDVVDIADVVYLVNYLFIGGPPPGC